MSDYYKICAKRYLETFFSDKSNFYFSKKFVEKVK